MKRLSKINLYKIVLACSMIAFAACSKNGAEGPEGNGSDEPEKMIQAVRVEKLEKSNLRKFIEVNGNIRAEKSMSVYPVIQGKIASTAVHLGSQVKKGDVIACVDPSVPGSRYALNEVTSPISGTVISIPLKEGTRVDTETAVVTIGDLSKLQITCYIPERYVSFLQPGLEADVFLEAYPDEKFEARVAEVSPVLDEDSRTKEVLLTFKKADSRVNAGMFAGVKLYLKEYKNVLSVPSSCIIEKGGKKYVYLIAQGDSKVCFTEIKTGEEIVDRTIIEFCEGENLNTSLVIQGFETLQDGSQVNIAE